MAAILDSSTAGPADSRYDIVRSLELISPSTCNRGTIERPLSRFQFSLGRLMVLVTVVAIVLGLAVTIQGIVPLVIASLVWCLLPTPFVTCAIFGGGEIRAFAVGGLVPWLLLLRATTPGPAWLIPIWLLVMPILCGVVAVVTYRLVCDRE